MGPALIVPIDLAAQVREYRDMGMSWSEVSVSTGLPRSTCFKIYEGSHKWASFDDMLAIHGHPEYGSELVWHDE